MKNWINSHPGVSLLLMLALILCPCFIHASSSNKLNLQQQSNGIAVYVDSKFVGNASSLQFSSSTGVVQVCVPQGQTVVCTPSYNSASLVTKQSLQRGDALRCVSSNGTFGYTCGTCVENGVSTPCAGGLNPVATATTVAPGMELEFVPDVPCAPIQNCSLNVDNTGLLGIRANDGGNNGVAISGNGHIVHRLAIDQVSGAGGAQLVWRLIY